MVDLLIPVCIIKRERKQMIVLDTPDQIDMFRLLALKGALTLECKGMKRRGRSVYSIVKEEFGLKGNKENVLKQFTELVEKRKEQTYERN